MNDDDSPCVGICEIDPESDRCLGCGRTSAQIFGDPEPHEVPEAELSVEEIRFPGPPLND